MKVSKKRQIRWDNMRPTIESEMHGTANPVYAQALSFCLARMNKEEIPLDLNTAHSYIVEIEDRVNYLIYQTTDILKTNALMECADIVREVSEDMLQDYRLEGDETP